MVGCGCVAYGDGPTLLRDGRSPAAAAQPPARACLLAPPRGRGDRRAGAPGTADRGAQLARRQRAFGHHRRHAQRPRPNAPRPKSRRSTADGRRTGRSTTSSPTPRRSRAAAAHGNEVALTFDDGPGPYTQQLVSELNRLGVHATFFAIGERGALLLARHRAGAALGRRRRRSHRDAPDAGLALRPRPV